MRLEKDKTGIYRHRHWRGLKDTLYDYGQWLKLWGILIKWAVKHPVINVKALFPLPLDVQLSDSTGIL